MTATSGFLTALECTNFFSAGAPPRTPLGELTALPWPIASLRGPTFKGREEKGRGRGKKRERGREREGRGWTPFRKFLDPPLLSAPKKTEINKPGAMKWGVHCQWE